MLENFNGLKQIDSLDFRNNKRQLIISYLLRLIGVVIFGLLFFLIIKNIKNNNLITLKDLLNIEIQSQSEVVSIILITADVIFILYLHELIHALIFLLTHKQKPKIGIRGFIIFAAAPDKILSKHQLSINALAPITVITVIGFVLIYFIPQNNLSWVFIPTLVNAAVSGGDFMTVVWVLKQPKKTKFIDVGDIITAYTEIKH